jgi:hypothetical protein
VAATSSSGKDEILGSDDYKTLIVQALKAKKMSKEDFNRAVKANLPAGADDDTKKASARQTLEFLQSKKVTVGRDTRFEDSVPSSDKGYDDLKAKAAKGDKDAIAKLKTIDEHMKMSDRLAGEDKTFKEYVVEAVKAKKMSRDDFNRAIAVHCGPSADAEAKKAAGAKVLAFLRGKGVTVG